ncbi:MAG: apolipoprotein N-acyltransferase, partial [Planctomycetota bacterium]|nr:apolipoprotein N-acyltransferase [Planctomycetota bacterium]
GATLAGAVFWTVNLYWLTWITLPGYFALAAYLTLYWLAAAAALAPAARGRLPLWLATPLVWTALEFARTYVISGFPWYFLAHTQYARTGLIQIADTTGQYGVTFFVALVNGAIADALSAWWRRRAGATVSRRQWVPGLAVAGVLLAGLLGYGAWRLGQRETSDGPVIGLVQEALPNRLDGPNLPADEAFALYARDSEALASARCDAVAWSEAILRGVNPEFLAAAGTETLPKAMARYFLRPSLDAVPEATLTKVWNDLRGEKTRQLQEIGQLAGNKLGCPIFVGAAAFRYDRDDNDWHEFNSVLLVGLNGQVTGEYDKVHPVPFSEYVPFRRSWPWLHGLCRSLVPPVMSSLEPGRDVRWFDLTGRDGRRTWRVATPICYEGTFDHVCRRLAVQDGRKRADLLLNLSNDGWFVLPGPGARPSTEHAQHLAHYCFRAVENRLPILRAANTGISASIDSCGRIVKSLGYERGTFAAKVLVDARTSLYSILGDAFASGVSALAAGSVILLLWRGRRGRDRVNAT